MVHNKIPYLHGPWSNQILSNFQSTGTLVTSIENGSELDQQPSDKNGPWSEMWMIVSSRALNPTKEVEVKARD